MPLPSLTDEIMDLVKRYGRCCWRAGAFDDIQSRCDESARGDLLGVSIYSRLTALETELEGYRKDEAAERELDALFNGPAAGRDARAKAALASLTVEAQQNGEYSIPPECSPRHASLDEAFGCEVCNNPARRLGAAVIAASCDRMRTHLEAVTHGSALPECSHPLAEFTQAICEKAIRSREEWRRDLIHGTSALPCSSEYASPGYVSGVPFVERGDESGG